MKTGPIWPVCCTRQGSSQLCINPRATASIEAMLQPPVSCYEVWKILEMPWANLSWISFYHILSTSSFRIILGLNICSRAGSQKYADLNKLARRFLEINPDSSTAKQTGPTHAYIEEVVDGIRKGENTECPICMEYADDPVLTPCAHRMCRECLLSSWRTPTTGLCPICRQLLKKTDLITCPTENQFWVDVDTNWKESSKVSKLFDCLERIRRSGSGEKSIVFSQWTSFFDLLEIPLKRRGIGFLRFDGKLAQKQRECVLKEFSETKEKMVNTIFHYNFPTLFCFCWSYSYVSLTFQVLLMSLKAGGVGLNLTAASNVFLMVHSQPCFSDSLFFLFSFSQKYISLFPPSCRIHGGILQLKSKQSCEFIVLGKSERCESEDSLLRYVLLFHFSASSCPELIQSKPSRRGQSPNFIFHMVEVFGHCWNGIDVDNVIGHGGGKNATSPGT